MEKHLAADNTDLHLLKQGVLLSLNNAWSQHNNLAAGVVPGEQMDLLKDYYQKRISKLESLVERLNQTLKA